MKHSPRLIIALSCLALSLNCLNAATNYWDGNGEAPGAGSAPAGNWATSAFWSPSPEGTATPGTWTAGDDAVFSAGSDATEAYTVTLGTATVSSFTVEEGALTLGGTGAVTLGGGKVFVNSGASLRTDNSARISATAGAVMTINGGTVICGNPGSAGSFVDVDMAIVLNGGGTLSYLSAGVLNIISGSTVISGTGPLIKDGAGILAIATACTYSGSTIISNGTLRVRTSSNRLPTGTDMFVYSPGALDPGSTSGNVQQVNSINGDGNITYSASSTLIIAGSSNSTLSGVVSDGSAFGRIAKQGTGTLTLEGVNTYDGSFTNDAGTTIVSPGATLAGEAADLVVNGGTLELNNAAQTVLSLAGLGGTINLNNNHALTINPAGTRGFAGVLAGNGSVTKTGTGTTLITGANTYTGPTTVTSGKLVTSTASTGAGTYSVSDGATLGVRLHAPNSTLAMSDLTLGTCTLEGDLNKQSTSVPLISVAGPLTVNGTVSVDLKGFDATGSVTILEYTGDRSGFGGFALVNLPPRAQASLDDDTVNKKVIVTITAGTGSLVYVGDGLGNWDANNFFNQVWKLASDGTQTEYQQNALQGDTILLDDTATGVTTLTLLENLYPLNATVNNLTKDYTLTGSGKLTGATGLTKSGAGSLTIATTNDYTGGTVLNDGKIAVGNNSPFGSGKLSINGGRIQSDSTTARTVSVPVDLKADLALGDPLSSGNLTFSTGPWTLAGGSHTITVDTINATISTGIGEDVPGRALTKAGEGILSLTTANSFTGGFNHTAGTVRVNSVAALGAANSTVTYSDGVTLSTSGGTGRTLTYAHVLNGNLTLGQTSGGTAAVTLAGTIELGGASRTITVVNTTDTMSGAISNGGLIKEGTGTLLLGNATNTYSGPTVVNAGTLSIDADASVGNGTGALILNGGKLNVTADRPVTTAPLGNPIEFQADTEITTSSTATTVNLNMTNSAITAGAITLTFRNDGANGAGDTFEPRFSGNLSFSRPIVIDNGPVGKTRLNFFNSSGSVQTFSGVISGSGSVRRSASTSGTGGKTIFTEANTYDGGTTINDGTLIVNNTTGSGTGSGAVSVSSSGALGGNGIVAGPVTATSGGAIAPGESAGNLTLQGGLNLSSGGVYSWELGAYGTSPNDADLITLTSGDLVLGGTSKIAIGFTGTAASPNSGDPFWSAPRTWTVISLAGGINPGDLGFPAVLNGIYTTGYFTSTVSSGNVLLNFTPGAPPQPELSTLSGVGTGSVTIDFTTPISGATYQVLYKNDLNEPAWTLLQTVTGTGSTAAVVDNTSPAPAQRFYLITMQ